MTSTTKRWAVRLLAGATMICWFGGDLALAQGLPSMPGRTTARPAMGTSALPSAPAGVGGIPLGSIQVYTGTLGGAQAPALGSLTICPTNGLGGAGATYPALSTLTSTGVSPSPASPTIISPLATFPITTSPVPTSPIASALPMNPAPAPPTPALANTLITPLGGTLPVASPFGTANAIGFCSPTIPGVATTPILPDSTSPTGAAFSDGAIPLAGTVVSDGGLSPLVDVPPPALFSPADAVLPAQ